MDGKYFVSFRMGFSPRSILRILGGVVVFFTVMVIGMIALFSLDEVFPFLKSLVEFFSLILFVAGLFAGRIVVTKLFGEPPSTFLRFEGNDQVTIWTPGGATRRSLTIDATQVENVSNYWVHAEVAGQQVKFPRHWLQSTYHPGNAPPKFAVQPSLPTLYFEMNRNDGRLTCNKVEVEIDGDQADKRETLYWPRKPR